MVTTGKRTFTLVLPNPSFDRADELKSIVQLREQVEGEAVDRVVWSADVRLQRQDEVEKVAKHLAELGFPSPDAELARLTSDAFARAKNGDGDVNPFKNPRFHGWSRKVIEELAHNARWIRAREGAFWMNGTNARPFPVDSPEMAVLLAEKFAINRKDDFYPYLVEEFRTQVAVRGEAVTLRELAHYDRQANRLILDMADGNVLVLDGSDPKTERNGAHGVLFKQQAHHKPWRYIEDHGWPLGALIGSFSFISGEHSPLTVDEQRTMLRYWVVSLFFRSEQAVKPLAVAVGDTGSGKSAMFRMIGRVLYGPDWDLKSSDTEKPGDFDTSVTNNLLIGYDNMDTRVRWLEDALCRAADGVLIPKRALYTTNTEVVFKPDCFLCLTARTPKFRRRDVAGRALIWHMAPRSQQQLVIKAERDLHQELERDRDRLLSELADICNQALRVPAQNASDSPIRSADHWAVVKRVAESLKIVDQARALYGKLRGVQQEFATAENKVVEAVLEWLEAKGPDGQPNAGREVSAALLLRELSAMRRNPDFDRECPDPKTLGTTLRELDHDGGLVPYFHVAKRRKGGHGPGTPGGATYYVITPPGWQAEGRLV